MFSEKSQVEAIKLNLLTLEVLECCINIQTGLFILCSFNKNLKVIGHAPL